MQLSYKENVRLVYKAKKHVQIDVLLGKSSSVFKSIIGGWHQGNAQIWQEDKQMTRISGTQHDILEYKYNDSQEPDSKLLMETGHRGQRLTKFHSIFNLPFHVFNHMVWDDRNTSNLRIWARYVFMFIIITLSYNFHFNIYYFTF